MVFFIEEASLGTTSENGIGFIATAGGIYQVSKKIGVGIFINYSTCSMKHEDVEFKVGGPDIGGKAKKLHFWLDQLLGDAPSL